MNKSLIVILLISLITVVNGAKLPQLVGIIDEEILDIIDEINGIGNYDFDGYNDQVNVKSKPGCDYSSYVQKFNQFTKDAGFDQSINYTNNGVALKNAINGIFDNLDPQDPIGAGRALDQFCMAVRTFFSNLAVDQVEACISPDGFAANGYSRVSCYQTVQVFSQMNYQCGAAFTTYVSYIDQYLNTRSDNVANFDQCAIDFIQTLNSTASVADFGCGALQTYETCVAKVYYQASNNNMDLGMTVCEATRRTNIITLPHCGDPRSFCDSSKIKN